jgi:DNA processing protein
MSEDDIVACIALTLVPGVGSVTAKHLLARYPNPSEIFKAPTGRLQQIEGIGTVIANAIYDGRSKLDEAKGILEKCRGKKIAVTGLPDEAYPTRLREIPDAPLVLYTAGEAEHNPKRTLSVVGTRKNSAYGKRTTIEVIEQLAGLDITIYSGLAFGIDTIAHKAALDNGLKTYAILATPLDKVYPAQNRELAIDIFKTGRLYSEYAPGSKIDARNFPMRNRIIAGLADATLVVEAGESGGALITATLAQDYDRQVFAVPGRLGDPASAGCLQLIARSQAAIFTSVNAFLEEMGWNSDSPTARPKKQLELPAHVTLAERKLLAAIAMPAGLHIDEVSFQTQVPLNVLAGMLLKLEFDGLVISLPGKKFKAADAFSLT